MLSILKYQGNFQGIDWWQNGLFLTLFLDTDYRECFIHWIFYTGTNYILYNTSIQQWVVLTFAIIAYIEYRTLVCYQTVWSWFDTTRDIKKAWMKRRCTSCRAVDGGTRGSEMGILSDRDGRSDGGPMCSTGGCVVAPAMAITRCGSHQSCLSDSGGSARPSGRGGLIVSSAVVVDLQRGQQAGRRVSPLNHRSMYQLWCMLEIPAYNIDHCCNIILPCRTSLWSLSVGPSLWSFHLVLPFDDFLLVLLIGPSLWSFPLILPFGPSLWSFHSNVPVLPSCVPPTLPNYI